MLRIKVPVLLLVYISCFYYIAEGANSRPVCSKGYYTANLVENDPKSKSVIKVSCTDPDNDKLTFSFDGVGGNIDSTFTLNSSTGELKLNKVADAEQIAIQQKTLVYPFTLRVLVDDGVTTPVVLTYFITITDINDVRPTITGLPSTIFVPEDSKVGTKLATCNLTDGDFPGAGNDVAFVKIKSGDPLGMFSIDYISCDLMLVRNLDFENTTKYVLVLMAYDIGQNNPKSMSSSVTLTVSVTDVNDNQPACTSYNLMRDVVETASVGSVLVQLNCTDKESKASLSYTILSRVPSTDVRLQVNSATGAITLNGSLDYEKNDRKLEVKIQVADTGFKTVMSTIVTVVFRVTDADDNPPVLISLYLGYISEDANIGAYVMTVNATDVDSPNTALSRITFGFEQSCSQPNWFKIDSYTGSILVNTLLDWETAPNVTCKVYAYSSNQIASRRISDVRIVLTDVNDRAPDFTQYFFEGSVLENSALSVSVGKVSAHDADSGMNGQFNFSLPFTEHFLIDPNTGVLTLNGDVDYENETSYLVLVEAKDLGLPTFSSRTYVNIRVLPVNEYPPVFTQIVGTQTISEASEPGSFVTSIEATDDDHGLDGQIVYSLLDNNVPFILEPVTGRLVVGLGLDAENITQYNLTVIASDQSETEVKSVTMSLLVNVLDVNDNPPTCDFVHPISLKSPLVNTPFAKLNCPDADITLTVLRYEIMDCKPFNIFSIDPNTGEISVVSVDGNPQGVYQLIVKVSDNGVPQLYTTFSLEVLLEVNLQFKDFPLLPVHLNENEDANKVVANVTATGAYDPVTYNIVGGNDNEQFSMGHYSGTLRLVKGLDRESIDRFNLIIQASTLSGQVITKTLDIIVDDDNDEMPTFPNSRYERKVLESVTPPQSLGLITAVDKDTGNNSLLTYSICSGNDEGVFDIDAASGELWVRKNLDSEATQAYNLELCVKDGGSPSLNSSTVVFVSVENINEFKPVITPSVDIINLTLSEDSVIGLQVLVISGSDPDRGSEVRYSIFGLSSPEYFSIGELTGEVYLTYPLDRETLSNFTFGVRVIDTVGQSATTTVSVTVTDVNDNDPVFDKSSYVFTTAHETKANTYIDSFTVTDQDNGLNGSVTLSISSGNTGDTFKIIGSNLLSNAVLDANDQNQYDLIVTATDRGNPPRSSSAYVTVLVGPEFKKPSFQIDSSNPITLIETLAVGSLVKDLDATVLGAKEGSGGDLLYSITSGDPHQHFSIEPFEGALTLVSPLDYSATSFFSLQVIAQNKYKFSLNDTVLVNVTLIQVNVRTPQFTSDVYNWTVNETAGVGSSVGKVSAVDQDAGQFGKVSYSLKSGAPFQINSSTGLITLSGTLEYSQAKSYSFYVTAIDNAGATSKTSSAVVIIYVIDFNNHAPTFPSNFYSVTLPESFPLHQEFLITSAFDLDSGSFGSILYSIASSNAGSMLTVDSHTGALSLQQHLDYESLQTIHLTIMAADGGSPRLSSTASVIINVEDVNDEVPKFPSETVELNIPQSTPALALIYSASASDKDKGNNGEVIYTIASGNDAGLFTIDTLKGDLKTSRSLMSGSGFYTLAVAAVDQGRPSLTGTVMVSVAVSPIANLPADASVKENEPSGTLVSGLPHSSSVIGYSITGGNYGNSFSVNNATRSLLTTKPLDREDYALYQLTITMWNNTGKAGEISLNVKVLDKNDNKPKFKDPELTIRIVENMLTGVSIGQVTAEDADEPGSNSHITYTMSSFQGNRYIALDSSTGQLSLKESISYETVSSLTFEVIAKDGGSPQLSSTATVNLVVYDILETVIERGFNTTYFISHEFPHDAAKGEVACTLIPEDFGLDPTVTRTNEVTSVGNNVFEVSSSGDVTVSMAEKIFENGRYFQWMVLTTSETSGTKSMVGLVRLDTFNKNKHLVAVIVSLDEVDLRSKVELLRHDLQAKFPAPNKVKVWQVQATSRSSRRKLLATESAAFTVVLADGASDSINNVDQSKTFLTQAEILANLQQSPDGTPVSGLSSNVPVTKVVPYEDASTNSSGLDTSTIILIVFAILAALIVIGVVVILAYYCCYRRRKIRDDTLGLVKHGETSHKILDSPEHEKIIYDNFPRDTGTEDDSTDDETSSILLSTPEPQPDTELNFLHPVNYEIDQTLEVNNLKGKNPIYAQFISSTLSSHKDHSDRDPHKDYRNSGPHKDHKDSGPHKDHRNSDPHKDHKDSGPHKDHRNSGLKPIEVKNAENPRPLRATFISSTYTASRDSQSVASDSYQLQPRFQDSVASTPRAVVATFISSSYTLPGNKQHALPNVSEK
ncbi:protocadherin Fat 4-like isoform X2 [Biomphalaria glabrata]|uniref:Protocadherin Fat 4-like isoform X2 n=1 Tax=Biomphalaria glabrata TaxID=6526 RepID=A0A9W3A7T5_BIOGL|nr:protocadherin Fat 4-like isoform X2 [Biomphalaria glabrata]